MYDYMKALQKRFDRQEHSELDAQVEYAQEELRRDMDAAGRKKLLRLLDAQNTLLVESKLMSFTAGFKLAAGIAGELGAPYSFDADEEQKNKGDDYEWLKSAPTARATSASVQTGVGRGATPRATTPKQESASSKNVLGKTQAEMQGEAQRRNGGYQRNRCHPCG